MSVMSRLREFFGIKPEEVTDNKELRGEMEENHKKTLKDMPKTEEYLIANINQAIIDDFLGYKQSAMISLGSLEKWGIEAIPDDILQKYRDAGFIVNEDDWYTFETLPNWEPEEKLPLGILTSTHVKLMRPERTSEQWVDYIMETISGEVRYLYEVNRDNMENLINAEGEEATTVRIYAFNGTTIPEDALEEVRRRVGAELVKNERLGNPFFPSATAYEIVLPCGIILLPPQY